mgnify:CR=1 FL=1
MSWDPNQYLAFADHRLRPALDLLTRIGLDQPKHVYDLGCGPGNVTAVLAKRWPKAAVVGVDNSPNMLSSAGAPTGNLRWQQADIATWKPAAPADLIYSNAALQWLDDHATLMPRLLGLLAPGGVLAVQMPRNHGAPSHVGMVEAALAGPWKGKLEPLLRRTPVAKPSVYYDLLRPHCTRIDIWETIYTQVLEGADPVVEWTKGTALKPLLDALATEERNTFLADYRQRMREAYPLRGDGRTLFPFRRLFFIAQVA